MELILEHGTRGYFVQQLSAPAGFVPPAWNGVPYACLIWDSRGDAIDTERDCLATALLDSGCRYVLCAGHDSEAWHDSVDEAFLPSILELPEAEIDRVLVMTTWHTGESEEEAAFFFVHNTDFRDVKMKYLLVVEIGDSPGTLGRLKRAISREARSVSPVRSS